MEAVIRQPRRGRSVTLSAMGGPPPAFPEGKSISASAAAMAAHWENRFQAVLPLRPDLILMPEMADRYLETPCNRAEELRIAMPAAMNPMIARIARKNACYIAHATAICAPDGCWRNGLRLVDRSGEEVAVYYKNFLVTSEIERGLLPGSAPAVHQCDFGRVGFAICFDLNFTELLDAYKTLKPDLLLFSSNYHGGLMQSYWAYQLRAYQLSALGQAPLRSSLRSPVGELLSASTNYFHHFTATANLDAAVVHLDFHWEKIRALQERFGRTVRVSDPGELGAVLITSEHETLSVHEMLEQFEIESLDGYLAHSRLCNAEARPSPL